MEKKTKIISVLDLVDGQMGTIVQWGGHKNDMYLGDAVIRNGNNLNLADGSDRWLNLFTNDHFKSGKYLVQLDEPVEKIYTKEELKAAVREGYDHGWSQCSTGDYMADDERFEQWFKENIL